MPDDPGLAALATADRAILAAWLGRVRARGIDAAVDLTPRPWNVPGALAVIGVFRAHEGVARWVIAWHADGWLLLRPHDGFIQEAPRPLQEVLATIEASGG